MKEPKDIGMPMKEDWEILQFDPNKIVHRQRELGYILAEKQSKYEDLTDLKKPTRDEKSTEFLDGGKGVGESEMRANASQDYQTTFIKDKLSPARLQYLKAKVDYESFCNWIQLLRSKGANLRTEMQLSGQL